MAKSIAPQRASPDLDQALARKAELEAALLEQQLSARPRRMETIKMLAGASGLILALISLVGGLVSIGTWFHEQAQNRELRIEERLDRTLYQLSEQQPGQRVAAIASITSFLGRDSQERNRRVLISLANALALEADQTVRNAITTLFQNLNTEAVGQGSRDAALDMLIAHNRGMMLDKALWDDPPRNWYVFVEQDARGRHLDAMQRTITSLLRGGARSDDLSGTYLVLADLSNLDLSGVRFDDALLNWSDFSNSTLRRASFDGANLDSVAFVAADLREAKLTVTSRPGHGPRRFSYVGLSLRNRRSVSFPDFSCADLRGADFAGSHLWNVTSDRIRGQIGSRLAVAFTGANLAGADFTRSAAFFFDDQEIPDLLFELQPWVGERGENEQFWLVTGALAPQSRIIGQISGHSATRTEIQNAFRWSNLSGTRFPPALRALIVRNGARPPAGALDCQPRSPW